MNLSGALKSNIGHLEGASGLAGVIKTVLVLERGVIPPNANFRTLNPQIDFSSSNVKVSLIKPSSFGVLTSPKVAEKVVSWPTRGLRRASVNCFGFGGANSHVVLDESYHYLQTRGLQGFHCTFHEAKELGTASAQSILEPELVFPSSQRHPNNKSPNSSLPRIFVFSAADENGLSRMATAYRNYFTSIDTEYKDINGFLASLAHTLSARRTRLPWKSFILGTGMEPLHQMQISVPVRSRMRPRLGFVFTGQGAQYAGMAKGLLLHPVILRSFKQSQAFLENLGCKWSAMDEMLKDRENSRIDLPEYSQTICTILQIALIDYLKCIGVFPRTACGHSSGEIAAAYCVGAISHQSAIKIAYFRGIRAGELLACKEVRGAMMAVGLSEEEARSFLPSDGTVCIACINSPMSVTLSGDEEELSQIQVNLELAGIFARKLQVKVAYHSYHVERLAESYLKAIEDIVAGSSSNTDMISSVTGHLIVKEELVKPEYWVRNMVSPVRFTDAISKMATGFTADEHGKIIEAIDNILEIGSHSTLKKPIEESLKTAQVGYYMCLAGRKPDILTLYTNLGQLYCRGHLVSINELNRVGHDIEDRSPTLAKAPSYPFTIPKGTGMRVDKVKRDTDSESYLHMIFSAPQTPTGTLRKQDGGILFEFQERLG
jgi:acyl transferase domain-containing protein